jgi:hypothetical protein
MTKNAACPADPIYADLMSKAALDAGATLTLIAALEAVFAGREESEALAGAGVTEAVRALPGKTPGELAGETAALRVLADGPAGMAKIVALRDSLYRYQSLYES